MLVKYSDTDLQPKNYRSSIFHFLSCLETGSPEVAQAALCLAALLPWLAFLYSFILLINLSGSLLSFSTPLLSSPILFENSVQLSYVHILILLNLE